MLFKHASLKYMYICTCCWGCWTTHTCAALHFFRKGTAADSHMFSSRPPFAGHWKLKYRQSTAIIPPPCHRATKSLHVFSTSTFLPYASEENSPECPAQACSRLHLLSSLPTTVKKCNACQGGDSLPLEGNQSMSHVAKDKPDTRLSLPLSLLCTSLSSSWPMCKRLSKELSRFCSK